MFSPWPQSVGLKRQVFFGDSSSTSSSNGWVELDRCALGRVVWLCRGLDPHVEAAVKKTCYLDKIIISLGLLPAPVETVGVLKGVSIPVLASTAYIDTVLLISFVT